MPDESAKASTTRVEVDIPLDHPIGSVAFRPVPGWSAKVTMSHLAKPVVTDEATVTDAVSKVAWSGGEIRPDEYQSFAVDAGPVPDGIKQLPFRCRVGPADDRAVGVGLHDG